VATISDVAKKASVSKSTVSRVLNGIPVKEENRQKVLNAMQALGYQPNAQARSLTLGKTDVVGVLVPNMDGPFYGSILEGCQQALWSHGLYMIVRSTHHDRGSEPNLVKLLWEKRVDGLIIFTPREIKERPMQALVKDLVASNFPLVVADGELDSLSISGVWIDNFEGGYKATKHLINLEHQKIGILLGPDDSPESKLRLNGYKRALKDHALPFDQELVASAGDYRSGSAQRIFSQLVDAGATAIFACSDELAYGVMEACKERGISIPQDLSLIGYDDVPFARLTTPKLTTVAQPLGQLGQVAAGRIARMISGEEREVTQITLPTKLVVRETTGPYQGKSSSH
jgi:DNA-binding LacI/PurR family transcriptional regulator